MSETNKITKKFELEGLCTPPVTVFKENGEIDLDFIGPYVDHILEYGIPNVFVNGTTGEGLSLSVAERKQLAEKWMHEGKGRLFKIIIQIGCTNLIESQELAKHAEQIGADAIACVGPSYLKPESLDSYLKYMAAVASHAPNTPFLLYDIDFLTGITFDTTEFFERGRIIIPTLSGVKHTSPNLKSIAKVHKTHPDIQLMLGSDEMYLEGLNIGVYSNIVNSYMGHILNRMHESFVRGDMDAAREEKKRAVAVTSIRKKYHLSIPGGTKTVLQALGIQTGQPRLPLSTIEHDVILAVKEDLEAIGFFTWGTKL